MKKLVLQFAALLLITLSTFGLSAQEEKAKLTDNMSITPSLGLLHFYGDIRQYDFYPVSNYNNETKFGLGLAINKTLSPIFGIQAELLYGSLSGTRRGIQADHGDYPNGKTFSTNILEANISALINLNSLLIPKTAGSSKWVTFVKIGHGLVKFDSDLTGLVDGELQKTSGKTTEAVMPIGLICNYQLKNNLDLGINMTFRNVNTDKLDAWEVDGSSKDMYSYMGVSLTYHLGLDEEEEPLNRQNPFDNLLADMAETKSKVEALTNDDDNDGVANTFDKDNETPEGVKVYGDGTSIDSDGDGVSDDMDKEPFTPKGSEVDGSGVSIDTDKDGVPDVHDKEPNSKIGTIVNYQGITIGKAYSEGGMIGLKGGGAAKSLPMIYFESSSTNIAYSEVSKIAQVAFTMKANPEMKIMLIGHADETGREEYNLKLSEGRANKVKDHLVKYFMIDGNKIQVSAKGEADPLSKNYSRANTFNRRVEVKQVL